MAAWGAVESSGEPIADADWPSWQQVTRWMGSGRRDSSEPSHEPLLPFSRLLFRGAYTTYIIFLYFFYFL